MLAVVGSRAAAVWQYPVKADIRVSDTTACRLRQLAETASLEAN